jgi:AcrR family transcriptional regulator
MTESQPKRKPKKISRNPSLTRSKLLIAAVDVIAEKGAEALTLKEAAEVAQVSRAVAYHHFKDRDHLVSEAQAWITDMMVEFVSDVGGGSLEEKVYQSTKLVLNNLEASKLVLMEAVTGKGFKRNHPLYRILRKTLTNFIESGEVAEDLDVEVLSLILLGSASAMILLGMYNKRISTDVLAQRFTKEWTRLLTEGVYNNFKTQDNKKIMMPNESTSNKKNHRKKKTPTK